MGLTRMMLTGVRSIRADAPGTPAPWDDFWYNPIGTRSGTGIRVTPESSKNNPTVLACVNKIAKTAAMLPLKIYSERPDGGKKIATNHPLYDVLYSRPNDQQSAFEWRQMMYGHLELRGNAYSEIKPGPRGAIDQLVPMHPDRVHPEQLRTGRIRYRYNDPLTNEDRYLNQESVFHLRNFMDNGIVGQSTVTMQADTIGIALAATDNYARFLRNDSSPPFILTGADFKTDAEQQEFREHWQKQHTGENRHKIAVLRPGMDVKSIGLSAKDAELIEARKFSRIEICSIFDVPPHLIGETEKTSTYASVEQFNIMFATFCIMPRLVLFEQAVQRQLIFSSYYFSKFSMGALLRGDTAARYGAYQIAIQNGWMSQNDVRIAEDMNPIEDGDSYWRPMNWSRLGDIQDSKAPAGDSTSEEDQTTDSTTTTGQSVRDERFYALAAAGAERIVRREKASIERMMDRDCNAEEFREFYRDHADWIASVLRIPKDRARAYCDRRSQNLQLPDSEQIRELTVLALGGIQ